MKVGSLFAGIGGFDLGFELAGMTTAWQVEIDDKARAVLSKHFPPADRSITDVTKAHAGNLGTVDLICGGFPCQDVSVAGRRAGLAGKRSGLWFAFHDLLADVKPEWVVIENVPGLLSSNKGRDFATILHGLGELRYRCAWRVLDAQYFGVPQRRRRVFIVGHLGNGRAASVLFERESVAGNPRSLFEAWQATPALFASGAGTGRTASAGSECIPVTVGTFSAGAHPGGANGQDAYTGHLIPVAYDVRNYAETGEVTIPLQAKGQGGHSLNMQPVITQAVPLVLRNAGRTTEKSEQNRQGIGIGAEGDPSPTLTDVFTPGVIFNGVRRLTPVECERLQGFPDGWTAGQSDSARYRQLGNAVSVPVAEWIGKRIMEVAS